MYSTKHEDNFNLANQDIDKIAIYLSADGSKCFISDKENKSNFYTNFIIYDGEKVKKKCIISFDKNSRNNRFIPRLTFYKENKNGIVDSQNNKVIIEFNATESGLFEFWKLVSFLKKYKDLVDTGDFETKYQVVDSSHYIAEFKNKKDYQKIESLKELNVDEFVLNSYLSDVRKKDLKQFELMLENIVNEEVYRSENNITQPGSESIWHHFLKNRPWILGLNTEIKFIQTFVSEASVGNPNTLNKENPSVDMLGVSDYTTLVELKTPNTKFFTNEKSTKARAGTWSFTTDFIEGVSQCLAQKSFWDKNQKNKDLAVDNNIVDQNIYRTTDPSVVFIIGNKDKELNLKNTELSIPLKRDTLERFARNNRNVVILTYDELYKRAYFMLHHTKALDIDYLEKTFVDEINDIPF